MPLAADGSSGRHFGSARFRPRRKVVCTVLLTAGIYLINCHAVIYKAVLVFLIVCVVVCDFSSFFSLLLCVCVCVCYFCLYWRINVFNMNILLSFFHACKKARDIACCYVKLPIQHTRAVTVQLSLYITFGKAPTTEFCRVNKFAGEQKALKSV